MIIPSWATLDAMSEKELFLGLGRESVGDAAVPQNLGSLIDKGTEAFRNAEPWLKALLCEASAPKASLSELPEDTLKGVLVTLIGSSGSDVHVTHIAAFYLAAIVVRKGLVFYCAPAGAAKPS